MAADGFVLLPRRGKGEGSGHLRRAASLEKELSRLGAECILARDGIEKPAVGAGGRPLGILDLRSASTAELEAAAAFAAPLALDDDGPGRNRTPYLIDIIPGPRSTEANLTAPYFMDLPSRTREPDAGGAILVSFGGEDPAGLTIPVLQALRRITGGRRKISCTLPADVVGPGSGGLPEGVEVLEVPENLKDRLADFGLVVCSYGLTAWEAIAAGCAVLTVDPSPYHAMLSMNAGMPGLGHVPIRRQGLPETAVKDLEGQLADHSRLNADAAQTAVGLRHSAGGEGGIPGLAARLAGMEAPAPVCVACKSLLPPVIARFADRTYYRCESCGMTGLYRFRKKEDEYGPAYFDREYEAQYGRSYLDDFDFIRDMGRRRMKFIDRRARPGGKVLDIGCAFGPFLAAAADQGYFPHGTDVSQEGIAYVRENLGYPGTVAMFPEEDPGEKLGVRNFDVVSLWYVIEHFDCLSPVLSALRRLVVPGGVLAFSTPNGAGISARTAPRKFLERSPADHYSIWTPRTARRILSRYGFRVYRVRVTGHHPERFPGNPREGSFRFRLCGLVSRIFGLGDTFEVYATRSGS